MSRTRHFSIQRAARTMMAGAKIIFLFTLLFLATCSRGPRDSAEGVQLLLSTTVLEPTTTFELRFNEPVVAAAEVGTKAEVSPLVIRPNLPGQFVWLSQRSGVYTPTAPPALATTYELTLRSGLAQSPALLAESGGVPVRFALSSKGLVKAKLRRHFSTPAMGVTEHAPHWQNLLNAPSEPEFTLQFNAEVRHQDAKSYLQFRDASGNVVAAEVRQATTKDYGLPYNWEGPGLTWRERFYAATNRGAARNLLATTAAPEEQPVPNRLVVWPAKPLPVGKSWKLKAWRGLPAVDAPVGLGETFELLIGDVQPFVVANAQAENRLRQGKSIELRMSKNISEELDSTNLLEWLTLTPRPSNFAATPMNLSILLHGDFKLDEPYILQLRAGFPAAEAFTLATNYSNTFTFKPLPPRLYFPAFSTDQLAGGRREIELLALNVPNLRLNAKLLDRHSLIHALRGYRGYYRSFRHDWLPYEPYKALDYNLIPGVTILETNFVTSNRVDETARIKMGWEDILGPRRHGPVFLTAERTQPDENDRARLGTQELLQLTDLGMVWKQATDQITALVFSYASGQPLSNVAVRLMSNENEPLAEARTDAQGVARLPWKDKGEWLLAESGDDLHALELARHVLSPYSLGVSYEDRLDSRDKDTNLMLFTDRAVYQPGEIVHLKGVGREWTGAGWKVPANLFGTLVVTDARGDKIIDTNMTLSAAGAFDRSIPLPKGVLGQYQVSFALTNGGDAWSHGFHVQEYQPNAFEVKVGVKGSYPAQAKFEVPVSAKYFMGKALSSAKVKWSLEADDTGFYPEGFGEFIFGTCVPANLVRRQSSSISLEGEGRLSSQSNLVINPEIPINPTAPQPRSGRVLVEVTDLNNQTISEAAHFTRHSSDFYLGLPRSGHVIPGDAEGRVGKPFPLRCVAVRHDGEPWPEAVQVQLKLQRVDWQTVRMQSAGRATRFRTDPVLTNILEREITTSTLRQNDDVWEVDPALKAAEFVPDRAGEYLLEVRAKDTGGREVVSAFTFNVSGQEPIAWDYRNEAQVELTPDRKGYQAGDTAVLLVKAPFSGLALVTVKRETVLRSFITNLTGNAPTLQIPLQEQDAPNVFVSLTLLRGMTDSPKKFKMPEYRVGYCRLEVTNPATRLQTRLQLSAAQYRPAKNVQVNAEVLDWKNQPVPDAEVTLYAVDEGVLALMNYEVPDLHSFFYASRPLRVQSGLSLPNLMPEDPEQLRFHNKGYLIGGGGEGGHIRKKFLACAFWNATLKTDRAGKVAVEFIAPDGLTRYRVIAVVHTVAGQFGDATAEFEVNKPLMLEPVLPRFANITDQFIARALVHNKTGQAGDIEIELNLDDKACASAPANAALKTLSRKVALASGASTAVEFPLDVLEAGTAQWVWKARLAGSSAADDFTDAVQSTLEVGYPAPLLREVLLERIDGPEVNLLARANPQLLEGKGLVKVSVSNTRLSQLGETIGQLLYYPYGCIEQTTSSLLPWMATAQMRRWPSALPGLNQSPAKVEQAINAGVTRLLSMQTSSGGLSYWPGTQDPMLWGSAYGGMALVLAAREGIEVPPARLTNLLQYLSRSLRGGLETSSGYGLSDRCLALYTLALAKQAEPAYHELLYKKRDTLSLENRALLALAILESQGPPEMAETLLDLRTAPATKDPDDWFGCNARDLAIRLLARLRAQPQNKEVDVLVTELMNSQTKANWGTTQGNAWGLLALSEYVSRVENRLQESEATLQWGNRSETVKLGPTPTTAEFTFATARELAAVPLTLANASKRRFYTQVTLEARPPSNVLPRQDRGYLVQRNYARLDDNNAPQDLSQLHVGDRILVTLQIEARQPAHFVAIDDPLPCLFEAIHPEFKSQETRAQRNTTPDWFSDFRELRTDRALFFRNHLSPGRYTIQYLARVRAVGTSTAPPAKVEEMYHPERFGLCETVKVTATE